MSRRSVPSPLSASLLDADTPLGLLEPLLPSKSTLVLPKVVEKISPTPPPVINLLDGVVPATVPVRIHRFLDHPSEQIVPEAPAHTAEAFPDHLDKSSLSDMAITVSDHMSMVETRGLNALPTLVDLAPNNSITSSTPAFMSNSMAAHMEKTEPLRRMDVPSFLANRVPAASSSLLFQDQCAIYTYPCESRSNFHVESYFSTGNRARRYPGDLQNWLEICPCNLKGHPCPMYTSCTHQPVCFNRAFDACKCCFQVNCRSCNFGHDNAEGRRLAEVLVEEHHRVRSGKYIERFKEPEARKIDVENRTKKQNENGIANVDPTVPLKGVDEGDRAVPGLGHGDGRETLAESHEDTADPRKTDFSFEGEHKVFQARSWRAYYERQAKDNTREEGKGCRDKSTNGVYHGADGGDQQRRGSLRK